MTDHRLLAASEARGMADRRGRLLAAAQGRVLEIGAGPGLNLRHYLPDQVSSVVALEPEGAMRRRLVLQVATSRVPVEVRPEGIAGSFGASALGEASFDTVVATLVLCSVADPALAARAIHRCLKPGGRLLFLEHVRAVGPLGRLQRAATPLWSRLDGGCRLDRDTLNNLRQAGLMVSDCERFALPAGGLLLRSCVQGVAWRRPVGVDGVASKLEGAV